MISRKIVVCINMRNFALASVIAMMVLGSCDTSTETVLQAERIDADSVTDIIPISDSLVRPVLYQTIPNLNGLSVLERKEKFIAMVLPAILVARHQITSDRERLQELLTQEEWEDADSSFYKAKLELFGGESPEDLLNRMLTHPNSIVLAQAAVESGWGSSRFFQLANNLFGIWSYNNQEPRVAAGKARDGKQIFVRSYPDISASVVDYFGTIARTPAYQKFRDARLKTQNVKQLLPHLKYYSERREAYLRQLQTIITQNKLTRYDHYQIDPKYIVENPN